MGRLFRLLRQPVKARWLWIAGLSLGLTALVTLSQLGPVVLVPQWAALLYLLARQEMAEGGGGVLAGLGVAKVWSPADGGGPADWSDALLLLTMGVVFTAWSWWKLAGPGRVEGHPAAERPDEN